MPQNGTSPTYNSWAGMLQRTLDPNATSYPRYGGRGVTVCDRWNPAKGGSFQNFLEDMGERLKGTSIDRIDNSGGYFKENCRWADAKTQSLNRRPYQTKKKPCQSVPVSEIVAMPMLPSFSTTIPEQVSQ